MKVCFTCQNKDDHFHQVTDRAFGTISFWVIDGVCYTSLLKALTRLQSALDCTLDEAKQYVKSIRKAYN